MQHFVFCTAIDPLYSLAYRILEAQMNTTTLTHNHTSPDFFSRIVDGFASFFEAVGEGRRIAQRYEALSRLSDAALATRGLTRQDIARAAVNGR